MQLVVEPRTALKAHFSPAGSPPINTELCGTLATPAICGVEVVTQLEVLPLGHHGLLDRGAPSVLNSTPDEAVVSFDMIVLLTIEAAIASCSEMPAPSQPATLLAMMLLVSWTEFQMQLLGLGQYVVPSGKLAISVPLTCCKRMPPPLPLSALLPITRLALITRPGPVPSLRPGAQSASAMVLPHSRPWLLNPSGGVPITIRPPPLVGMVGFLLSLNRIELCSMLPPKLTPSCANPPPSPVLRLPQTQL